MSSPLTHSTSAEGITLDISGPRSEVLVILVHGTLDRSAGMARVAREISPYVQVVRYDRRGYSRSNHLAGPFTVQRHIDDLVSIVGDRTAILIGHSFGGNVALGAAEHLQEQILGVSTYETPLSWMPWWSGQSAGAAAMASDMNEAAQNFMIRLIGYRRWEALPEKTKIERRAEGPTLVGELSSLREGPPWNPMAINSPAFVGVGTKASEHHRKGAEWIAEHIPRATLEVFDGAGHGAPITHAKEFALRLIFPHLSAAGVTLPGYPR